MSAPKKSVALSAAALSQSLAAKKKAAKASVKNVLAQPYERYWPECSPAEAQPLLNVLTSTGAWRSPHRIAGMNATLRALSTGRCALVLLDADIRPKFIVEQTLLLAFAHSDDVRCLLVAGLRDSLRDERTLKLPACMCVSFGADLLAEHASVRQLSDALVGRFPVPAIYKRAGFRRPSEPMDVDADTRPTRIAQRKSLPDVQFDRLYVRKTSGSKMRAFIPAGSVFRHKSGATAEASQSSNDWSEFIALGDDAGVPLVAAKRPSPAEQKRRAAIEQMKRRMRLTTANAGASPYVTLKVNRVQGNPDRVRPNKK